MSDTAKSSVAVKDERVTRVFCWLSRGKQRREIIQLASDWDVTDRTIDNYIAAADEHRGEEAAKRRTRHFGESLRRYRDYERHAFEVALKNEGTAEGANYLGKALAARRAICELGGLNEAAKIELQVPKAWLGVFDEFGIRIPGDGKNGTHGGENAPEVRH